MGTIATTTGPAPAPSRVQVLLRRMRDGDEIAHLITLIFGASILLVTAALVYELWPKVSSSLSFVIDLLAAVPSVIYGVLAIFLLEPLMRSTVQPFLKHTLGFLPIFTGPAYGFGFLTAGIVLAIMVVPFIISVSREVLMAVPQDQREASLGLGATKWETTYKVVVGYARTGILGSVFLSMARALGETMAVTMVIGNVPKVSASLFSPGYSIAAVIANEFAEASAGLHLSALIELGLVLFVLTFILNGLARVMIVATSRRGAGASR